MLEWALATFVKGMEIRLRKNWLSILAKREVPQSRNCLWYDELMINYNMGCVVYDVVNVIKSEWMNEWACITFCNQARRLGGGRGQFPPLPMFFLPFLFFFLFLWLVSSVTYGDDDNTPTQWRRHGGGGGGAGEKCPPPLWFSFFFFFFFLVVSSVVGHDSTPTPLFLKSEKEKRKRRRGKQNCQIVGAPPPPPPPLSDLFQDWRRMLWLARQ